jgi:hypothetical protein
MICRGLPERLTRVYPPMSSSSRGVRGEQWCPGTRPSCDRVQQAKGLGLLRVEALKVVLSLHPHVFLIETQSIPVQCKIN